MRAKDLMSQPVVTVGPQDSAHDAAALLARHGFTAMPVVGPDGDLVGIVTEADLMRGRILADPRTRHTQPTAPPRTVGDIMATDVVVMTEGTDVAEVARVMLDGRLRAVPIVRDMPDGARLVGILTRRDLMRAVGRDDALVAADIRHRLQVYGGTNRWAVTVQDGHVTITDSYDDPTELHIAEVLAFAVPGVASVQVTGGVLPNET
jgi:CBS domain-containing protein